MAKATRFDRIGGPEVLRLKDIDVFKFSAGEVHLSHAAEGRIYTEDYSHNGSYPSA